MRREFVLNLFLLVLINVLIKPFFIFGIDLTVQNRTAPGAYGLYFALLNWTYLFQILNDFGLQNFNSRHVSQHPHLLGKYFPKFLTIKVLLSTAYFVVALLAAAFIGRYHTDALQLLAVLLFNQVLTQGVLFVRSAISGLGFYRTDSWLSALDKLLMLVFCGAALWWHPREAGPFPIEHFAWAQTLALVLTLAIVLVVLTRTSGFALGALLPRRVSVSDRRTLWFLLRKSLPYALVVLLMSAYTRLDGILLERLLPDGAHHAGVFAGGYRLLDAANMFGYLFATLLMPMFARLLGQKAPVRPLVSLGFRLVWAGGWTLCVVVFLLKSDLAALMFGVKYELEYRAWTLGLLIWAFPAMCVIYIFSTLLTADERLMQMNRFFVVGLVLDVVLNLLLVPHFLALGAAMATVATQWFIAIAMVALCVYNYGFRPSPGGLTRVLVFTAAVPLSAWWLLHNDSFNALSWWWKPLLLLLVGGLLALLSGLLSRRDLHTV